jgi:hypothetical protein
MEKTMESAKENEIERALDYESMRNEYPPGFPSLPEIPGGRYTRRDFYELDLFGIQDSLESGAFTGMRLGYQERRIYRLHEEIDRRIGRERIPAELAVEQVLASFLNCHQRDAENTHTPRGQESACRGALLAEEGPCP